MRVSGLAGVLAILAMAAGGTALLGAAEKRAESTRGSRTVHDFRAKTIEGVDRSLADYRGKAVLIVNTASKCGYTPQYRSLEDLYEKYHGRGFEVLAFPANNFMNQEPGTNQQIRQFCTKNYRTTFPLFSKISVRGKGMHPLYRYLTRESGFEGAIEWNFTKFLVASDGRVVARFGPGTDPLSAEVTSKIESLLPATEGTTGAM
jgi:glutathione peroxidase